MNLSEISNEFNKQAKNAEKLVKQVYGYDRQTSTSVCKNGIRLRVLFRQEEDYNIFVPWKIIDQGKDAIEKYFSKFYRHTKNLSPNEIAVFSEEFEEKQLKNEI